MSRNLRIAQNLGWKLLERFGVQGVQFILQIILARLLDPEHYGVLSLMVIFTTLANVFIQRGFNTALIQNKDVTEEDYSSVFWVTVGFAVAVYVALYAAAPVIALFYNMPDIVWPFRILNLVLFPGALNSIQLASASREMDFKKVFYSNVGGIIASGMVGMVLAVMGAGLWALVAQNLLNTLVACIIMSFTVKWKLLFVCNVKRVQQLFSFGWKLLVSSLVDTLYQDVRSLVIGIKYDSGTLGYYNRGKHFPQFIINAVNGAVQSVLLPVMSAEQDDTTKVKSLMRNSTVLSSYIIFPMMAGLAGVAAPLVELLLTEKWLPCVPYMQIYCITLAFYPVHTSNLQAINAMGRSDIFLKLEIAKKGVGIISLVIAVLCFDSPIVIALTGVLTSFVSCFINAYPSKQLTGYSYEEQMRDILPSFLVALIMCGAVLAVQLLNLGTVLTLIVQLTVGVAVYIAISAALQLEPFRLLLTLLKNSKKEIKRGEE